MPTYFIDTNVFLYAKGKEHPLKPACVSMIKRIGENEITAIINTEVIQEILYRYQSIKNLPLGLSLAKQAIQISSFILPVTATDLSLAMDILEAHPQIQTRDAFHAATMINNGIKEILSTDAHFDLIPEIRRIAPGL
jgi:predicted nucleic acid-binding protein